MQNIVQHLCADSLLISNIGMAKRLSLIEASMTVRCALFCALANAPY